MKGRNCVLSAASNGCDENLKFFHENYPESFVKLLNQVDDDGESALELAASGGKKSTIEFVKKHYKGPVKTVFLDGGLTVWINSDAWKNHLFPNPPVVPVHFQIYSRPLNKLTKAVGYSTFKSLFRKEVLTSSGCGLF